MERRTADRAGALLLYAATRLLWSVMWDVGSTCHAAVLVGVRRSQLGKKRNSRLRISPLPSTHRWASDQPCGANAESTAAVISASDSGRSIARRAAAASSMATW